MVFAGPRRTSFPRMDEQDRRQRDKQTDETREKRRRGADLIAAERFPACFTKHGLDRGGVVS